MDKKIKIIGSIASILAIMMVFSSIEILISNYEGKSHIVIQPSFSAINGFIWGLYAFLKKDWYIFIPNLLSLIISLLTIIALFI